MGFCQTRDGHESIVSVNKKWLDTKKAPTGAFLCER